LVTPRFFKVTTPPKGHFLFLAPLFVHSAIFPRPNTPFPPWLQLIFLQRALLNPSPALLLLVVNPFFMLKDCLLPYFSPPPFSRYTIFFSLISHCNSTLESSPSRGFHPTSHFSPLFGFSVLPPPRLCTFFFLPPVIYV